MRDEVFLQADAVASDFAFDAEVAAVFDDMLERSVPFYPAQQEMVTDLAVQFWTPGSRIYDLGCSTATTLVALAKRLKATSGFIGYDSSEPMIERARQKVREEGLTEAVEVRQADFNGDLEAVTLENPSVVIMCWTLQFIRPARREAVLRHIYDSLANGGALILTEKILSSDVRLNRLFIDFYQEYKKSRGYTDTEIARKREALENVLVPYRLNENIDLLKGAGFDVVESFFQWFNFAGLVGVKKPAS